MVLERDPFREKLVRLDLPLFINVMIRDGHQGTYNQSVSDIISEARRARRERRAGRMFRNHR